MITGELEIGEKWHQLAVKTLSILFQGITQTHNDGYLKMLEAWKKILKFTQNHKFLKIPYIFHASIEWLLEKIHTWGKDPIKTFTSKINKHTQCRCSLFTHCSFDTNKRTISTEIKTLWKSFVQTFKKTPQKWSTLRKSKCYPDKETRNIIQKTKL